MTNPNTSTEELDETAPSGPPARFLVANWLRSGTSIDPGKLKPSQEDALLLPRPDLSEQQVLDRGVLFVVADGVGGLEKGEQASQNACQYLAAAYYRPNPTLPASQPDAQATTNADLPRRLLSAVKEANNRVYQELSRTQAKASGTTLVCAVVLPDGRCLFAHVGDSRLYIFRADDKRSFKERFEKLTTDHSWVEEYGNEMVVRAEMTPEQLRRDKRRHIVTRVLGAHESVRPTLGQTQLRPRDRLLLCTDGLWEMLTEKELIRLLSSERAASDLDVVAGKLVKEVLLGPAKDNVAVMLVDYPAPLPLARPDLLAPAPADWTTPIEELNDKPPQTEELFSKFAPDQLWSIGGNALDQGDTRTDTAEDKPITGPFLSKTREEGLNDGDNEEEDGWEKELPTKSADPHGEALPQTLQTMSSYGPTQARYATALASLRDWRVKYDAAKTSITSSDINPSLKKNYHASLEKQKQNLHLSFYNKLAEASAPMTVYQLKEAKLLPVLKELSGTYVETVNNFQIWEKIFKDFQKEVEVVNRQFNEALTEQYKTNITEMLKIFTQSESAPAPTPILARAPVQSYTSSTLPGSVTPQSLSGRELAATPSDTAQPPPPPNSENEGPTASNLTLPPTTVQARKVGRFLAFLVGAVLLFFVGLVILGVSQLSSPIASTNPVVSGPTVSLSAGPTNTTTLLSVPQVTSLALAKPTTTPQLSPKTVPITSGTGLTATASQVPVKPEELLIKQADEQFERKKYAEAVNTYTQLCTKFPGYNTGEVKFKLAKAQAYYAEASKDEAAYLAALKAFQEVENAQPVYIQGVRGDFALEQALTQCKYANFLITSSGPDDLRGGPKTDGALLAETTTPMTNLEKCTQVLLDEKYANKYADYRVLYEKEKLFQQGLDQKSRNSSADDWEKTVKFFEDIYKGPEDRAKGLNDKEYRQGSLARVLQDTYIEFGKVLVNLSDNTPKDKPKIAFDYLIAARYEFETASNMEGKGILSARKAEAAQRHDEVIKRLPTATPAPTTPKTSNSTTTGIATTAPPTTAPVGTTPPPTTRGGPNGNGSATPPAKP